MDPKCDNGEQLQPTATCAVLVSYIHSLLSIRIICIDYFFDNESVLVDNNADEKGSLASSICRIATKAQEATKKKSSRFHGHGCETCNTNI